MSNIYNYHDRSQNRFKIISSLPSNHLKKYYYSYSVKMSIVSTIIIFFSRDEKNIRVHVVNVTVSIVNVVVILYFPQYLGKVSENFKTDFVKTQ